MAILALATLPAEVARLLAVSHPLILKMLTLEVNLPARVDVSVADHAANVRAWVTGGKRPRFEFEDVSFFGASERENPVSVRFEFSLLIFTLIDVIGRTPPIVLDEVRLEWNLLVLVFIRTVLGIIIVLIIIRILLDLLYFRLLTTEALFVHGEVAAVVLASVEGLTKVVDHGVGASRLPVVVFGAVLPLALASVHGLVLGVVFFVDDEQGDFLAPVELVPQQTAIGAPVFQRGIDLPLRVEDFLIVFVLQINYFWFFFFCILFSLSSNLFVTLFRIRSFIYFFLPVFGEGVYSVVLGHDLTHISQSVNISVHLLTCRLFNFVAILPQLFIKLLEFYVFYFVIVG